MASVVSILRNEGWQEKRGSSRKMGAVEGARRASERKRHAGLAGQTQHKAGKSKKEICSAPILKPKLHGENEETVTRAREKGM
jgi:hypothetical protein